MSTMGEEEDEYHGPSFRKEMEDCPVYADDAFDCEGWGRGEDCSDFCRYFRAEREQWEEQARMFHELVHGSGDIDALTP